MEEFEDHRGWLASTVLSLVGIFALAVLAFGDQGETAGWAIIGFVALWLYSVFSFFRLIIADTKLAKAIGVDPPLPIWLIYLLGFWPIGTIWLDVLGSKKRS